MWLSFLRYFFHYLTNAKTRLRLLYIAIIGLILSSFSLLVLQATMGGLQNGLITRSKKILGNAYINLRELDQGEAEKVFTYLRDLNLETYPEYVAELLVKNNNILMPVIVHGIDFKYGKPAFLETTDKFILGDDLSYRLKANAFTPLNVITPVETDSLLGDVPRFVITEGNEVFHSNVPEVDSYHAYTKIELVQNLVRSKRWNTLRIYTPYDFTKLKDELTELINKDVDLIAWEQENKSLMWALNLESKVMVFLFICMNLLVAISITSGFLILFDKVKIDLISFWLLGSTKKQLINASTIFIHLMSFLSSFLGIGLALLFLHFLDVYAPEIMPDIFVDRRIPVLISLKMVLISLIIPYLISVVFALFALKNFENEQKSFVTLIRSVGR
ncbi:MAG: hypothetical protein U0T83_03440 [Bacteriovoracaceae bacterium]